MSQSLRVYLTDLRSVNAAIGSSDLELVARIAAEQADDLWDIDDVFETAEEHGPGVTATEILTELVRGELTGDPSEFGDLYSELFLVLCRHFGGHLIDDRLGRCSVDWLNRLDARLESGAVPVRLSDLWCRASVIDHPQIGRVLDVGYWTAAEAAAASPTLDRLIPVVPEGDDREALQAIAEWCRQSGEYPECTLLGSFG